MISLLGHFGSLVGGSICSKQIQRAVTGTSSKSFQIARILARIPCLAAQRSVSEPVRNDVAGPDAHAEAHESYMSAVARTGPQKRTPLQGLFDDHNSHGPPVDHQSTWTAGRLPQSSIIKGLKLSPTIRAPGMHA
jgi:hypothetical protein